MNKEIYMILISLILVASFSAGCGKKTDYGKYKAVCERVQKCDKAVGKNAAILGGDAVKGCQKMLGNLLKKKGAAGEASLQCLKETKCEELSFVQCILKAQQGMPAPGR